MPRTGQVTRWEDLELEDLLYAYRKAKADCFFERTFCIAEQFVAYESNLHQRLSELLGHLHAGEAAQRLMTNLGTPALVAKKLQTTTRAGTSKGHGFFSDQKQAFDFLLSGNVVTPEFRVVGDFPGDARSFRTLDQLSRT
jgi:hypothetical protein